VSAPGLSACDVSGSSACDLSGLRVAIANWRDPWHPDAGGAERYAWEIGRGLVARGAEVCYLTARAPGQARRGRADGITVTRMGGRFTVYARVLGWLLAHRRSFDAVLDCQNGIPFFTPWVLPRRVPVLCVVHHVHTVQFGVHFPRWMAWAGKVLEGPVARLAYRRHACVAVSPSTVTAMRERLRWTGDIYLIPNGAPSPAAPSPAAVPRPAAAADPGHGSLTWVGRLVAHKRAELILPIAQRLAGSGLRIDVVGRGPAAESLANAVATHGLSGAVRLRGFLPEADKQAIVAGSLLHLNTSQGEGWGLCVLEAAALGVPTVAYDVDGLRDAVRDGHTGWLVRSGEKIEDVTERAIKELADPARRHAVAVACQDWASQLDWERSRERMAALIKASVHYASSRSTRSGAWIVSGAGNSGGSRGSRVLAEGPVLDLLLAAHPGGFALRPATPLERLLGRAAGEDDDLR
jgi:glycosyltransferase involved in cell wall biosynthesis